MKNVPRWDELLSLTTYIRDEIALIILELMGREARQQGEKAHSEDILV